MPNRNTWIRPTDPDEQGSFCDTSSGNHYNVVRKDEAEEIQETAMRAGEGIVAMPAEPFDYPDDQKFKVNKTDIDGQGNEYPSRYGPGR